MSEPQGVDPNLVIEALARRIAQLEINHAVEVARLQQQNDELTKQRGEA